MLTLSKIRRAARYTPTLRGPLDPLASLYLLILVLFSSQLLTMEEKDPKRLFEGNALIRRLVRVGVLDESRMKLDYVLALKVEDFLERRLQTCVYKLGLAKSIHHARVLIKQRHIRLVQVPRYIVRCRDAKCSSPQCRQANRQRPIFHRPSRFSEAHRLRSYFTVWRRASRPCQEEEGQSCRKEG